jgi:predicted dehydrogenase
MWMRFVPMVVELRKLLREGVIGDVRMLTAQLGFPWEHDPKHRLFDPELGGGALLDLGGYPLSLAFHLLGRPTGFVTQAVLGKTGVDEQAGVLLTFEGERQAAITTSLRSLTSNDATITGSEGVIHLHTPIYCPERITIQRSTLLRGAGRPKRGLAGRLKQLPFARDVQSAVAHARQRTITKRALGNGYTHEAIEVMRCLREGALESPLMPLDETQAIMETMDAIRLAWTAKPARRA